MPVERRKSIRAATRSQQDPFRILIADDDPVTRKLIARYLRGAGFETIEAADGMEAIDLLDREISVALFDLRMPRRTGLECLSHAREHFNDVAVIVISGTGEIEDAVTAIKQGAFEYITKPVDQDELIARVNQACWASQVTRDNANLREVVNLARPSFDFVAQSEVSQTILEQVSKVSPLDSTVLITGESGTGKTTVARMIHESGPRSDGPFVVVNCASLPRDLVEAELFGHTKGAFTGAIADRPGRAEIADGGTLFLDEIGDLPLALQPKLLTFLQHRTFERIGSTKTRTVDVRLIAATHQDLAQMCSERRFREDLYFRLNVITLHMPALRDRLDDISQLCYQILERISSRRDNGRTSVADDALLALNRYPWPGNVRELENILERASVFCADNVIQTSDLLLRGDETNIEGEQLSDSRSLAGMTLAELEKQAILDTLEACGGNKAEAARRLGISEKSIYNKMKRHEL